MSSTSTKPRIGEPVAVLRHDNTATEWALSEERTVVFTVEHEKPNPALDEWNATIDRDRDEGEEAPPATIIERVDYTMPAKPNPGLALRYLRQARQNADLAMSWLVEVAIGEEGYDALADEMGTMDDPEEAMSLLRSVVERVQKVAMGGLDDEGHRPKA